VCCGVLAFFACVVCMVDCCVSSSLTAWSFYCTLTTCKTFDHVMISHFFQLGSQVRTWLPSSHLAENCQVRTWLPSKLVVVCFLRIPTVTTANGLLGCQVSQLGSQVDRWQPSSKLVVGRFSWETKKSFDSASTPRKMTHSIGNSRVDLCGMEYTGHILRYLIVFMAARIAPPKSS